jgi:hypothetical protein
MVGLWYYLSKDNDLNCIKKHPKYISGEHHARNAIPIDTNKVKALAKLNGATLNDLMMAIVSMTF